MPFCKGPKKVIARFKYDKVIKIVWLRGYGGDQILCAAASY